MMMQLHQFELLNIRFQNDRCRYVVIALLGLFMLAVESSAADQFVTPLELSPYRVRMLVAFDAPYASRTMRDNLLIELQRLTTRCLGIVWQPTVEEIEWLQPVEKVGLSRLKWESIESRNKNSDDLPDVCIVIAICEDGGLWKIAIRNWQPEYRVESDVVQRDVADARDIPSTVLKLCYSVFSPVAKVDEVDGKSAKLIVQGSALSIPDPDFSLSKIAFVFVPALAYRNRDRRIEKMQSIPWTYLHVADPSQLHWLCEIQSGLKVPISGKQRGRIENVAIAIRPNASSTRLELATQGKFSLPLIAHRIELRDSNEIPKMDNEGEANKHVLNVLLTDRRGVATLPAQSIRPIVWLFAYSGNHLLARVPFAMGSVAKVRLEVPNDGLRLQAESELQVLQGQLIETVAARNTTYSRIRAKLKANKLSPERTEEKQLEALPDSKIHLEKLNEIRVLAIAAAKARKDRTAETRINRMCDEMRDLVNQYLNEDKRRELMELLKETRTETASMEEDAAKEGSK